VSAEIVQLQRQASPKSFTAVLELRGMQVDVEAFKKAAIAKQMFSATQLAKAAGVGGRQVWRLYEHQPIPYRSLMKIATALGLTWPDQVLIPAESERTA
jgi:uncharacterized protein YggE